MVGLLKNPLNVVNDNSKSLYQSNAGFILGFMSMVGLQQTEDALA